MRLLVVEDEKDMNHILVSKLEKEGYNVDCCFDGNAAIDYLMLADYDGVIMDIMLPGLDGFQVLKKMRAAGKQTPVLFLSAKGDTEDIVEGLDTGADDYMVKPFGVLELAARIRGLLRRAGQGRCLEETLFGGGISVCQKTREVISGNRNVELTLKEYELLVYLMKNDFRVVPREELLNQIWGYEYDGESRTLDMHIRTLRQKLGEEHGLVIKTVRGVGYRFIAEEKGVGGRC